MATRGSRGSGGAGAQLPEVVPFDLAHLTRLSWELGSRVIDDDGVSCHGEWEHRDALWAVSVFDVTGETVVVRVRTPTGREHFYGAACMDFEAARPALDAAPAWRSRG